jgi:periplasmic copper chaperone A
MIFSETNPMTHALTRCLAIVGTLTSIALSTLPACAQAHETLSKDGTILIQNLWTRATPNGAKVAGGFITITNKGTAPDRLIGGSAKIAGHVEVHEMAMDNGVMKMRELPKGLEIKPGETVELKPGGFHIMLMNIKEPTVDGGKVEGTLVFEKAGTIDIFYHVRAMGATSGTKHQH